MKQLQTGKTYTIHRARLIIDVHRSDGVISASNSSLLHRMCHHFPAWIVSDYSSLRKDEPPSKRRTANGFWKTPIWCWKSLGV